MGLNLKFTPEAILRLEEIFQYLKKEWSEKKALDFINKVFKIINLIQRMPDLGQSSGKKKFVRRFVVTKQISMYYRTKSNDLEILTFFDNRMHPDKLKVKKKY